MNYSRPDTGFMENAIGVDPPGCGCTDCIIGDSIPIDDTYRMVDVAKDYFQGREIINRSSGMFSFTLMSDGVIQVDINIDDSNDSNAPRPISYAVFAPR